MLRFGLIGYGQWGQHHAVAINATPGIHLAAIACATPATQANAQVANPGVTVTLGYRALLALNDIDAVAIVTPNYLHAEMAVAALTAGKDVLLEKPMALTVADCARINAAAVDSGRTVSVVHQFRLSSQWGAVKTLIASGAVGAARYANISLFRFPFRSGAGGWRYDADKVGSWTLEEAVHFFDIVMWYFEDHGYPETVTATGNARTRQPGLYENFTCTLRWANGSYATITQALGGFENHLLTEIAGTDGAVRAWWSGATDRTRTAQFELKHTQTNSSAVETRSVGPSGEVFELAATYCRINEAFQSKRPLVAGKEAVKSVHVCLEAQRSLTTGQTVTLNF